jgi:hypothetical protein
MLTLFIESSPEATILQILILVLRIYKDRFKILRMQSMKRAKDQKRKMSSK